MLSDRVELGHPSLALSDPLWRVNSLHSGKGSWKTRPASHDQERKGCDVAVGRWEVVPNINDSLDEGLQKAKGTPSQETTELAASEAGRARGPTGQLGGHRKVLITRPPHGTAAGLSEHPAPQAATGRRGNQLST
uniref:Uncharacterized protein n=1 Tax=Myotis myotis TaxID=51298 RepID=A0A7J7S202_MYOMY|nr:hypothetical protein mMyoMyo1_010112 [Myotis myotis]